MGENKEAVKHLAPVPWSPYDQGPCACLSFATRSVRRRSRRRKPVVAFRVGLPLYTIQFNRCSGKQIPARMVEYVTVQQGITGAHLQVHLVTGAQLGRVRPLLC
jgi:hypothetical protein